MKLLDFFENEKDSCINCPWSGDTPPLTGCNWKNTYPKEYQFALKNGWLEKYSIHSASICLTRTETGSTFYRQLQGDFT